LEPSETDRCIGNPFGVAILRDEEEAAKTVLCERSTEKSSDTFAIVLYE
jgi:hypothetical protein